MPLGLLTRTARRYCNEPERPAHGCRTADKWRTRPRCFVSYRQIDRRGERCLASELAPRPANHGRTDLAGTAHTSKLVNQADDVPHVPELLGMQPGHDTLKGPHVSRDGCRRGRFVMPRQFDRVRELPQ